MLVKGSLRACHLLYDWYIYHYKEVKGGVILEKVYDYDGRMRGYVDEDIIYDSENRIAGYTDGSVIYNRAYSPMAYVGDGYVRRMDGTPVGRYRESRLYDMYGNYIGYGNSGFRGLLGATLLLLLFGSFFNRRF
ncbi:MAG: hypothetical protein K0S75_374 [Clostridia bacterium]|jgi:hypothetical protein|nr:hypothetical protein [Clostridia bacterium]